MNCKKYLNTVKLLIVDELSYVPFTVGSELLFEVFSQRYEHGVTLVTHAWICWIGHRFPKRP